MPKHNNQPELCPDCPVRGWVPDAIQRIKDRELIKTREQPSNLKICMELRRIIREYSLFAQCPYFTEKEKITNHL